jgi:hypothetical protein
MTLDVEREQTVQLLCRQFALDNLTTQELESRLDAAYRAKTSDELRALVAALPPVPMGSYAGTEVAVPLEHEGMSSGQPRVFSVFGSVRKRGDWEPAEHMRAMALFGELQLDFREARLRPGITTVHISATFSQVRVIVPPGLHVECDGSAILGEFTEKTFLSAAPSDAAPTLRIVGTAVLSQVSVRMRLPDESALQALKREWGR